MKTHTSFSDGFRKHYYISLLFACVLYIGTLSHWNLNYFFTTSFLGGVFDSLGESLLTGSTDVNPGDIAFEAFTVEDGRTVTYFGFLPALNRIVFNLITPEMRGRWARASMLLASLIALSGVARFIILQLQGNISLTKRKKLWLFYLSFFGFALGSPVAFLVAEVPIYHESTLWGLAFSCWGLYFLARWLRIKDLQSIFLLSLSAGGALLARVTFAIPLYIILAIIGFYTLLKWGRERRNSLPVGANLCMAFAPAIVACALQGWYNHSRFGSVSEMLPYHAYAQFQGHEKETITKYGSWNIERIPLTVANYFAIDSYHFSRKAPFVHFRHPRWVGSDRFLFNPPDHIISLSIASPWLIVGGLLALLSLRNPTRSFLPFLFLAAFFVQVLLSLTFHAINYRYTAELLPFLLLAYGLALSHLKVDRGRLNQLIPIVLSLAIFVSIVVTTASNLSLLAFTPRSIPGEVRENLADGFIKIDRLFAHLTQP